MSTPKAEPRGEMVEGGAAGERRARPRANRKAVALDPADSETRCRIGNVHLATGSVADALSEFGGSGRATEAVAAYKRVLEIPDHGGSHVKAREALDRGANAATPGR